jgi:hypothetical protein
MDTTRSHRHGSHRKTGAVYWFPVYRFLSTVKRVVDREYIYHKYIALRYPSHSVNMLHHSSKHISFANPVVRSVSRKPTRVEYRHMNLLESHTERCAACEPLLRGRKPSPCRRGEVLEIFVLHDLIIEKDGYVYSVYKERGYPVRVEVSRNYWAVLALLRQVIRRSASPSILPTSSILDPQQINLLDIGCVVAVLSIAATVIGRINCYLANNRGVPT